MKEENNAIEKCVKEYMYFEFERDCVLLAEAAKRMNKYTGIYGVPRGGIPLAVSLSEKLGIPLVEEWVFRDKGSRENILIADDVMDSGKTREKFKGYDFYCIHVKEHTPLYVREGVVFLREEKGWIRYPWESGEANGEDAVIRILEAIGEDPNREGLRETPSRVIRSWGELYGGYSKDPERILKVFEEGACDEMVTLKDIEFYSMCEHHMLPFFGKVHIGYIPDRKVAGVSKLARLVEVYARRLQIQERMTTQIADALETHLKPKGVMVVSEAQHLCMVARGINKQNSVMVTSAIRGDFKNEETRSEFLTLIGKGR